MAITLDNFDVDLLNLIQIDNLATAEALSRSVPLSPSAIARRLRRLHEIGAVEANVAILSTTLSEARLRAILLIQLQEHAQGRELTALRQELASAREVQFCAEITGPFDLVVHVAVRGMDALNRFADQVLAASSVVRRYETTFVKKELKNRPTIWLDEKDIRA